MAAKEGENGWRMDEVPEDAVVATVPVLSGGRGGRGNKGDRVVKGEKRGISSKKREGPPNEPKRGVNPIV